MILLRGYASVPEIESSPIGHYTRLTPREVVVFDGDVCDMIYFLPVSWLDLARRDEVVEDVCRSQQAPSHLHCWLPTMELALHCIGIKNCSCLLCNMVLRDWEVRNAISSGEPTLFEVVRYGGTVESLEGRPVWLL